VHYMAGDDIDALFFYEPGQHAQLVPVLSTEEMCRVFGASAAILLGRGSFGETWRLSGMVGGADPDVAVKVILNGAYPTERLAREVEGLRRTSSNHVVRLLGTSGVDLSIGRRAALRFEYVPGGDVDAAVAANQPTYEQINAFASGVLAGVVAMHRTDTVHRDLKPENIALRGGDWTQPVLLDLGLAKILDMDTMTAYPTLLGTLPFMAPEQVRMEPARKGADLWAVGVILHLLLTGKHPFFRTADDALTRAQAHARMVAGAPALPADVPEPLRTVAARLLNKAPNERGSAARALRDLTKAEQIGVN